MISFNCVIQEGVIPDDLRPTLSSELSRISADVLGGSPDSVAVKYEVIPHGFGFRGGEVSTTSSVRGLLTEPLDQETRVVLLQQLCDMWCEVTGCSIHEVIVSARDPQ